MAEQGIKVTYEDFGNDGNKKVLVIDFGDIEGVVFRANGKTVVDRPIGAGTEHLLRCLNWLFRDVDTDVRIMEGLEDVTLLRDEWR